MYTYKFLEHTADVRIQLEASSFNELFHAGALAIAELLRPGFCQQKKNGVKRILVEVESVDQTSLLIDFLSDLLSSCYTEKMIFCSIDIKNLSNTCVAVEILGSPVDHFEEDIKAVTYHEADVTKNKNGNWTSRVIVDI